MKRLAAAALLSVLMTGSTAAAQTSQDDEWDFDEDPGRRLTIASTLFSNGLGLAVRCRGGSLDVVFAGLPEVTALTRTLNVGLGEEETSPESWTVGNPSSSAFSHYPAPFARRLREGGVLNVVVPGDGGAPNRRYVLELPPSPAAVEATLTACGRELQDPRDARLKPWVAAEGAPAGMEWLTRPTPEYPSRALGAGIGFGVGVVSCVTNRSGRLEDCVLESEHPPGVDFGREILKSAARARMRATEGSENIEGRMVTWRTNFLMEGVGPLEPGERPPRPARRDPRSN